MADDAKREHSPLPAGPPATLEAVHAICTHMATVLEVTASRVERLEADHDKRELAHTIRERYLTKIATRLSDAALRINFGRALGLAVPSTVVIVLVCLFAFVGGAAAQVGVAVMRPVAQAAPIQVAPAQ